MNKLILCISLMGMIIISSYSSSIASTTAWWQFENNYNSSIGRTTYFIGNGSGFSQDSAPFTGSSYSALFEGNATPLTLYNSFDLFYSYTLEFFIKADNLNNSIILDGIFAEGRDSNTLEILNGAFSIYTNQGTIVSDPITIGNWYHVAVVKSVSRDAFLKLYINYNLAGTLHYDFTVNDLTSIGSFFTGKIDELRISDNVLTSDEFLKMETSNLIPEPYSLLLLLCGTIGLLKRTKHLR